MRQTFAILISAAVALHTPARAQDDQPAPAEAPTPVSLPAGAAFDARLRALRPADPRAYLLLAEEIADVAAQPADFALAAQLYALAFELDRLRGWSAGVGASACLGLAQLSRVEHDRRWLIAMAGTIDRRYSLRDWSVPPSTTGADETAYNAATVLGLARAGEGIRAADLLAKPGVRELLQQYERAIGTTGQTGALFRLNRAIQSWPCPECKNARIVARTGPSGVEYKLCATCRGNPGPTLSDEELIAQLRFEALLLNGVRRSWAAQIATDQASPLRDPEPDQLAPTYGVEASRAHWRDGAWAGA